METVRRLLVVVLTALACACDNNPGTRQPTISPPVAEKRPHEIVSKHGHKRTDNYYWLNQRQDSAVIEYLRAENKYCDTMMWHTRALQDTLYEEMKNRLPQHEESVPFKIGKYFYYTRTEKDQEYPIFCRRGISINQTEEIIADGNELSKGQKYFAIETAVSPDHRLVGIITDTVGRNFFSIRFKDLSSGSLYPERIHGTARKMVWYNDNKAVLYALPDPVTLIENKIYKHTLGTPQSMDELVYFEKDSTIEWSLAKSKSGKFLLMNAYRADATASQYIDADNVLSKPQWIEPLQAGVKYSVDHAHGKFYIVTNRDARNYRVVEAPLDNTGHDGWRDVVPHNDSVLVEKIELFRKYYVLQEVIKGSSRLRAVNWSDGVVQNITFDEPFYLATLTSDFEFDTETVRLEYQSMTTPRVTYDYNLNTGKRVSLKVQYVSNFNRDNYKSERFMVKARDGEMIPLSIIYRKDMFKDGTNPCVVYGYGAYGASLMPYFNSTLISIFDRGLVFAIAHVRGGQELGGQWYDDGKMLKKMNTFTDFIDCSEYLVQHKIVAKDKLVAWGGSAGGLLMGSVANMRPDLYKAIIAQVPFVDIVTSMMDENIPLVTFEYKEWGNPANPQEYEYMLAYSPYDNVVKKDYPNILATSGLHDSQVPYWEPAKWVAKLRSEKTDNNVLLLSTSMSSGHTGSSGRFQSLKDRAFVYAFILDQVGIQK